MKIPIYQIDAFTSRKFGGNPAAVMPLTEWLDTDLMQTIAMENNLSETVFFVKNGEQYDIRWFTPAIEINLCGHATLASAFTLFNLLGYTKNEIVFNSQSGKLSVRKENNMLVMDFPSWMPEKCDNPYQNLDEILGINKILATYRYRDLLVEVATEADVVNASPDYTALKKTGEKIILTAPGNSVDFVSRFFAPAAGIDEDPVTGSAHSQLIPFWSKRLGKKEMNALQLSTRRGEVWCKYLGERVLQGGNCVFYMQGEVEV